MKIYQAVKKMMEACGISAKELSQVSGVSPSRLSQFLNGYFLETKPNGKSRGADLSSTGLDEIIEAAQKINPRARWVFCSFVCDSELSYSDDESVDYESMSENEFADQLVKIGKAWKRRNGRKLEKNNSSQELLSVG